MPFPESEPLYQRVSLVFYGSESVTRLLDYTLASISLETLKLIGHLKDLAGHV